MSCEKPRMDRMINGGGNLLTLVYAKGIHRHCFPICTTNTHSKLTKHVTSHHLTSAATFTSPFPFGIRARHTRHPVPLQADALISSYLEQSCPISGTYQLWNGSCVELATFLFHSSTSSPSFISLLPQIHTTCIRVPFPTERYPSER